MHFHLQGNIITLFEPQERYNVRDLQSFYPFADAHIE